MTGYVPNPAAPPPGARHRAAPPVLDLAAAGLGLVAFALAFLPWLGVNCAGVPAEDRGDCERFHYSGWELPAGTAGTVLLLVAALLLVRRLIDSTAPAGSAVPALLALLGAVLIVVQLVIGYNLLNLLAAGNIARVSRKVSLYLALAVALAEAGIAVWAWLQASGRLTRRPAAAPVVTPAGPGQPWQHSHAAPAPPAGQGWGQHGQPPPAGYGQADYPQPGGYAQPSPQGPPTGYPSPPAGPGGPGGPGVPGGPGDPYPPQPGERGTPRYP